MLTPEDDTMNQLLRNFIQGNERNSPGLSIATAAKHQKVRRKRPYTHSAYVCQQCRKSHRKCIHPNPALQSSSMIDASAVSNNRKGDREDVIICTSLAKQRKVLHKGLDCDSILHAPIQFYCKHISGFFAVSGTTYVATTFWNEAVPQLAHSYPLLSHSMLGLCYLFEACPRPMFLKPEDVLSYLDKTLRGLQYQLSRFKALDAVEKVVTLVVTTFLAIATFHGVGCTGALNTHVHGLHALLRGAWKDFVSVSSPARRYFLAAPSHLVKSEQLPIRLQDLKLLEPLLTCIPEEDFDQPQIAFGSVMHLLALTNKAIHARSRDVKSAQFTEESGNARPDDLQVTSIWRDFCAYRATISEATDMDWMCSAKISQDLAYTVRKIFEQATFMFLRRQCLVQEHNLSANLGSDLDCLKAQLYHQRRIDPSMALLWPEIVLHELESRQQEAANTSMAAGYGTQIALEKYRKTRDDTGNELRPWSDLDELLSRISRRRDSREESPSWLFDLS